MFLAFYVNLPQEEQSSSRLVLFGPGIESERYRSLLNLLFFYKVQSNFRVLAYLTLLPVYLQPRYVF